MQNLWLKSDAERVVAEHAKRGIGRDLALRVYTTRLLGGEPALVLHGGGNTSVKTVMPDLLGEPTEVLCVKGSGWDMGTIEAPGLPAVRLDPLRRLLQLDALSDEEMVNVQRCNLLDSSAPNPSVETLLHAFLPHKYIDHTHANAVLSLTNQPDGEALAREVYEKRAAIVPYIMPGFALAKRAQQIHAAQPDVEGLILLKHGIFSFGDSAEEAYRRMIELVSLAEARLAKAPAKAFVSVALPQRVAPASAVAPILRGLTALAGADSAEAASPFVVEFRQSAEILAYVNGVDVARYSQRGTVTPDHVIRTKPKPLLVPTPELGALERFREAAEKALAQYEAEYRAYFERGNALQHTPRKRLDTRPRVVLVPGLGLFALGKTAKDARIAADLAQTTVSVITDAERLGSFDCLVESDLFEMEYWSLEQAKLGKERAKPLQGRVVVVTGGGSGIGRATAQAFAREGAEVAVLDLDASAAETVAKSLGGFGLGCDLTRGEAVGQAFERVAERFGGVDIVVSNAGAAFQGAIADVDDALLRKSFELNFFAHQSVAQSAVRLMRAQGLGGVLLFNVSKQAINPGPGFGPYGLPKAATLALMRQYALEYGSDGIRSNAVNADRIRSGLLTNEMIAQRSKARGVSAEEYMAGNLLGVEVTADDVARAFVALALAPKTTAAVMTVDGGNIAAALR